MNCLCFIQLSSKSPMATKTLHDYPGQHSLVLLLKNIHWCNATRFIQ